MLIPVQYTFIRVTGQLLMSNPYVAKRIDPNKLKILKYDSFFTVNETAIITEAKKPNKSTTLFLLFYYHCRLLESNELIVALHKLSSSY